MAEVLAAVAVVADVVVYEDHHAPHRARVFTELTHRVGAMVLTLVQLATPAQVQQTHVPHKPTVLIGEVGLVKLVLDVVPFLLALPNVTLVEA